MIAPTLTPHQLEVLLRVHCRSVRSGFLMPVNENNVGSKGALAHLMQKGYIEIVKVEHGPRGGETRFFQPTALGIKRAERNRNKKSPA
jgi:hypothetical protein